MNNTYPAIRLTRAGRLAVLATLAFIVTVVSFMADMPWVYMASVPTTIMLFLFTADAAEVGPKR